MFWHGGSGNATLVAGSGNDLLVAGGGSTRFVFNSSTVAATDTLSKPGVTGTATLDFSAIATPLTVNLGSDAALASYANRTIQTSAAGQAANFKNVILGSGNATVTGNGGNDRYAFGAVTTACTVKLNQPTGSATNLLDFSAVSSDLSVNLASDSALASYGSRTIQTGGAGQAARFQAVRLGSGNNTVTGNSVGDTFSFGVASKARLIKLAETGSANSLDFSGVSTPLTVNLGSDTLASYGNTTVTDAVAGQFVNFHKAISGNANATLIAGPGNDTLIGGAGVVSFVFKPSSAASSDILTKLPGGSATLDFSAIATTPLTVNLASDAALASYANRTIQTSAAGQASNFKNVILGIGNATVTGNGGNDSYYFGPVTSASTVTLNQPTGSATNLLDFSAVSSDVGVNLASDAALASYGNRTIQTGGAGQAARFQAVRLGSGNNTVTGNSIGDMFYFGVASKARHVTLAVSGNAADTLNFSALPVTVPVTVSLSSDMALATYASTTVSTAAAGEAAHFLTVVDGFGNDSIVANAGNDTLISAHGHDTLVGGSGSDVFYAHNGLSTQITGGPGNDIALVDSGLDTVSGVKTVLYASPPVISAALSHDTGTGNSDHVTSDPSVAGSIGNAVVSFKAGLDAMAAASYFSLLPSLTARFTFALTPALLNQIAGGTLAQGTHVLHLLAVDALGATGSFALPFTFDTIAPVAPTLALAAASDTPPLGDGKTTLGVVSLTGKTEAGAMLVLMPGGATAVADASGNFTFANITLALGANSFTVTASDAAGNSSSTNATMTRISNASSGQVVLDWNTQLLNAVTTDASAPPVASRAMAMAQAAVSDAANAIDHFGSYLMVNVTARPGHPMSPPSRRRRMMSWSASIRHSRPRLTRNWPPASRRLPPDNRKPMASMSAKRSRRPSSPCAPTMGRIPMSITRPAAGRGYGCRPRRRICRRSIRNSPRSRRLR